MSKQTSDDFDNDHTDELPVLVETVTFEDERDAERTASYQTVEHGNTTTLQTESAQRLAELEAQRGALAERRDDLERQLAEKDALIGELQRLIATLRDSANGPSAAEHRLATQLAAAEARIVELAASVERLERDAAEGAASVERLRTDAEIARREADALKGELAARPAASEPAADLQALLEENATLTAYIAARRAWWEDAQAERIGLEAKVAALQHELSVSLKRLEDAEAFAARESSRAVGLRSELVEAARRVSALERELRELRAADATATAVDVEPNESQRPGEAGEPTRRAPTPDTATTPPLDQDMPVGMDGIGSAAPAVEAVAQLEAEVEYKRQQVAAQLIELRDRDQLLRAATGDIERVRRELASARNELEEARSAAARLEHAVIDKDRALQARDARIDTLQEEVKRLNAADKLGAPEARLDPLTTRATAIEPSAENAAAPALLCLTGEAPKRFVLTKKAVVIGRGQHCDVQILTHFVSREHARITLNAGRAVIEDAGSRNGVFVNAVRVDRQMLQHGDLITIGDTQFRFVESMAH